MIGWNWIDLINHNRRVCSGLPAVYDSVVSMCAVVHQWEGLKNLQVSGWSSATSDWGSGISDGFRQKESAHTVSISGQPILSRLVEVSSLCLVCIVCGFWITRPKQEVAVLLPQQPVALWSQLGGVSLPGFSITFCGRERGLSPQGCPGQGSRSAHCRGHLQNSSHGALRLHEVCVQKQTFCSDLTYALWHKECAQHTIYLPLYCLGAWTDACTQHAALLKTASAWWAGSSRLGRTAATLDGARAGAGFTFSSCHTASRAIATNRWAHFK